MTLLFLIAGLLCIAGALGVVLAKQPVHQVLSTVLNFIGLAVLYLTLDGEFMGVIQIIVYGGAVMVLFLFVISLLSARKDPIERDQGQLKGQAVAGYSIGGAVLLMLALVGLFGKETGADVAASLPEGYGQIGLFGTELFTRMPNLLPFEIMAFILMVAVIGVVLLVGRQKA